MTRIVALPRQIVSKGDKVEAEQVLQVDADEIRVTSLRQAWPDKSDVAVGRIEIQNKDGTWRELASCIWGGQIKRSEPSLSVAIHGPDGNRVKFPAGLRVRATVEALEDVDTTVSLDAI